MRRAGSIATSKTSKSASSSVLAQYGRLPMAFEPALPQQHAKFLAHGDGYTIFLNPNETTFALRGQHANGVLNMKFDGAAVFGFDA